MKSMEFERMLESLSYEPKTIPHPFDIEAPIAQNSFLINGELHNWDGPMQDVYSPICMRSESDIRRRFLGRYPLLSEKEAFEALDAAERAYGNGSGIWPMMCPEARIDCVEKFTQRMSVKRSEVVNLLMWEIGKTYSDSEKEFDRTIDYIHDTINALKDLDRVSSRFVIERGVIGQIRRAPLGVVLCMGPFNYPLNETFTTLIPALIMGNTIIFKPPKLGVLLHGPLLEAFRDSFPPGVVNTIYGEGPKVIGPIISSGKVNVLAFIGSSRVADILRSQHPKLHRLRCVLGLEAKNAGIILQDAELDLAIRESLLGTLSYNGQRCTALKILFVHSRIVDAFLDRLCSGIAELTIGKPWDDDVYLTPLPEKNKTRYLQGLVEDAVLHGARVINMNGGAVSETFFYPAVLYPVSEKMRVYHEEQFGPVIPVVSFERIEEPLQYIMDSPYGQQVSIFGQDSDQIAVLIDQLVNQVCRVNINSQCQRGPDAFPFTGRKDSAEGTLSVSDALRVFTIRTLVAAKESESNKAILNEIVHDRKSAFLSTDYML
jgi:glyceraldehyde-3-phosphate dehydrogenase (NADP+)